MVTTAPMSASITIGMPKHKTKTKTKENTFSLSKMRTLDNAVTDTLEELELEEHIEGHIEEIQEDRLYHVTFQEIENGNNRVVVSVEYIPEIGDLMDDESWEGEVEVNIIDSHGMGTMMPQIITELLAITLDPDYYDTDEEESDDETESIASQPLTPPPLPRRQRWA